MFEKSLLETSGVLYVKYIIYVDTGQQFKNFEFFNSFPPATLKKYYPY